MTDKPFHNPFGALGRLRDRLPAGASSPAPAGPPDTPPMPHAVTRAVVRLERRGRGGKEVTVVEQLGLPAAELHAWLTALKGQLGCGGAVEGDALLLQGDHRRRLAALLTARGVKRVTVG
ncbi:MAG: translation initiation factor [Vicinamibacterales bacterium]